MYVCIHIYIYIHVNTCMWFRVDIRIHMHVRMCIYIIIYLHINVYILDICLTMYTCTIYTYVRHVKTYARTCLLTDVCT